MAMWKLSIRRRLSSPHASLDDLEKRFHPRQAVLRASRTHVFSSAINIR